MTLIIDELEKELTQLKKSIIDLNNDNEKKEIEKKDLSKEFYLGIIDILDSIERIEEYIIEKNLDKSEGGLKVINRYNSIKKKLTILINKYGVTKLEFSENRLIVGYCKVVDTEPDSEKKNDTIISIIRNGYIRGSELIREAELIVVKN